MNSVLNVVSFRYSWAIKVELSRRQVDIQAWGSGRREKAM